MSAIRLLSLLAVAVLMSAYLLCSAVAQDPTSGCFTPFGDPTTGPSQSDVGYYDLYGLQSFSSSTYNILCSFRALYNYGPNGARNVWAPWHGNPKEDTDDCNTNYAVEFGYANDWASSTGGSVVTRLNNATGKLVIVSFSFAGVCSPNIICAGVCPGSANYESAMASLQADPTVRTTRLHAPPSFSAQATAPAGATQVISTLNATAATNTSVQSSNRGYPVKVMSVVTSITACYGNENVVC